MKILITGAKGQLGKCIKDAAANYPEFDFLFAVFSGIFLILDSLFFLQI